MEKINYAQIYTKVVKGLSPKIREVFERRFGVKTGKAETLESVGKSFDITRERVRQIQEAGFTFVRKNHSELVGMIFQRFEEYFTNGGGLKKEDLAIEDLGGAKHRLYIPFFLNLGEQFSRVCEKKEYHNFWTLSKEEKNVQKNLAAMVAFIKDYGKLLTREELFNQFAAGNNLSQNALASCLEVSKIVKSNRDGKIGLIFWPEVNPKNVKDRALLVMRSHQKPLHFREIAKLIDASEYGRVGVKTNAQTVHNELIKSSHFVLVGRGVYALAEWGYSSGTVKDVIAKILQERPEISSKEEIVNAVLAQRLVAKNTVLINLNNRNYFNLDDNGRYVPKGVDLA